MKIGEIWLSRMSPDLLMNTRSLLQNFMIDIKNVIMRIDGDYEYYLCCNDDDVIVASVIGSNIFTATLDYVVSNGLLHAIDDHKIIDHCIDHKSWCAFCRYHGKPNPDKYTE